ncbi:phosphatase PAP2 family protein [Luteirhabdus pelagi]|uniref:phosphatase PAP2 family protein n=1 Tax=Luteirhabdus pelagi TaxID=2792783 RepID=UPI00193AA555|nr:phosphatase PAP2 family protein [Luteirhabdus pelagi]
MLELLKHWDQELFIFLNNLGIERYDAFWITITQEETWTPLFIIFIGLIFFYYRAKKGGIVLLMLLVTVGLTMLLTNTVKESIERLRPNNVEALSELIRILQRPSNFSFFSGHASSSFSVTTFMVLVIRHYTKWIYLAYLWPLLFVASRIFVGVHYPSDIVVGAMVGVVMAYGGYVATKRILVAIR